LAILAGLSPSQNVVSNSNSAVNTSIPVSQHDSPPLEANITTTDTADSTSLSCQRPSLSLPHSIARSETLESPAYVPSDFSMLPNDVTETQVSEPVSSLAADAEQTSNSAHQSHNVVASVSIETETAAVASVSSYEKLMPAQPTTTGKTSKFAASVRRKFTVSKTVLPSTAAPPVVVFSKLASEAADPREVQNVDDVGRVHIVNKPVSSDVSAADKSQVGDVTSSPGGVDIPAAMQPVAEILPPATNTLEATVITRTGEPAADNVTAVLRLQQEMSEHDSELAKSPEVPSVVVDVDTSGRRCDKTTDAEVELCSGLGVQQSAEVDTTSCAASEQAAAETSTLASNFGYRVNDWVGPPDKDAETNSIVGRCGMVEAVNNITLTCHECDSELNSPQHTTNELPCSDASDAVPVAQATDSTVACSTVEQTAVDVTFEAPLSSSSNKHDAPQQNLECDNSFQISELTPTVATTQHIGPQDQIDD